LKVKHFQKMNPKMEKMTIKVISRKREENLKMKHPMKKMKHPMKKMMKVKRSKGKN
jgi:hypothetical protein